RPILRRIRAIRYARRGDRIHRAQTLRIHTRTRTRVTDLPPTTPGRYSDPGTSTRRPPDNTSGGLRSGRVRRLRGHWPRTLATRVTRTTGARHRGSLCHEQQTSPARPPPPRSSAVVCRTTCARKLQQGTSTWWLFLSGDHLLQVGNSPLFVQRRCPDVVPQPPVLGDFGLPLQVQAVGISFQVHDWPGWFGKVHDDERPHSSSMHPRFRGKYLDGDMVGGVSEVHQVFNLFPHHIRISGETLEGVLLDHRPQLGGVLSAQNMLPTDPGVHSSLDVLGVAPESGALHEPSQTRSLQQTGDSEGLIVRDAGGLGLQLYVGAGENVIVPGPPSALLSVPNKG